MMMDDATGFSKDGGGGCNLNMNNPASGKLVVHDEILSKPVEPTLKDVTKQILACCIASLTVVQVGLNMSFSAVLLPDLESGENVQKISKSEASWIASILVLSTPIGSILSGPICDKIGRKRGNMLTCVPTVFAWGIIAFSSGSVYGLYLARILAGLGGGMTTIFIVYASEICHEKYRPMLLSLNSIAVALGIMIVTINGVHMHWKTMALIYGILTFATFFLNWFFTPESPFWLMMLSKKSGNRIEAEKALKQLNPNKQIYTKKLQQVLESSRKLEETRNNKKNEKEFFKKIKKFLMNILLPETLLPLLLLTGLLSLQQLSGGYSIIFYTIHVFKKLGGNFGGGIDEYDALLMLGIIRFIMSIVAGVLARLIGRRPLLITSSLGMAISSFSITLYQNYFKINTTVEYSTFVPQMDTENKINSSINFFVNKSSVLFYNNTNDFLSNDQTTGDWFPMVCILLFISAESIGLLNIPWTLMGEMLPTSIRGIGSGFIVSFGYMVMFITIKIYPFLLDSLGVGNLFMIQGIVCLIIIIFTYLFIPETLGKSLNEIEKYFSKRKIIYTKN